VYGCCVRVLLDGRRCWSQASGQAWFSAHIPARLAASQVKSRHQVMVIHAPLTLRALALIPRGLDRGGEEGDDHLGVGVGSICLICQTYP
jgi:hypothetical protein